MLGAGVQLPYNERGRLESASALSVAVISACTCEVIDKINKMVSQLENAMESLIRVFHNYSSKEGDKYKLSKLELKSLLQGELCDFLAASKDPMVVEKIMTDLDENRDGEVDFQEFVVLVAALTVACNEFFVEGIKHH
ncbi:hypothetical protein COCON_G00006580 [Conger conger]|uniref:Protein S100 n=1 Tax=Conger conger TaxID=82655 RepID=A0A9Q1I7S6_CONCO|nr:hypothetical protein COCON_G00006580 [Conger conger]